MGRASRKEWLLLLWEYHNGSLREDESKEVDLRTSTDTHARTDSDRVLGIINELRQSGRWETHPEFPSQMVDRLLDTEGGGAWRWVLAGGVVLLLLLYLLFGRGDSEASGLSRAISQVRSVVLAFFEKPSFYSETKKLDTRHLQLEGVSESIDDLHEDFLFSATLELDNGEVRHGSFQLNDPVPKVEKDLDRMFEGGFAPHP